MMQVDQFDVPNVIRRIKSNQKKKKRFLLYFPIIKLYFIRFRIFWSVFLKNSKIIAEKGPFSSFCFEIYSVSLWFEIDKLLVFDWGKCCAEIMNFQSFQFFFWYIHIRCTKRVFKIASRLQREQLKNWIEYTHSQMNIEKHTWEKKT